ncbi:hypothetical protein [Ruegeria arenilitoris]|uniref:hypothetical protein n=1 Tax=Ruegeria arenilitoris TaxID=1173585 RepID=UPI0020C30E4E|nr:hypothetical protein [Ruegeria arenilitoris]
MPIDETALRQWADRHECRSNLPILVRRLIRETTPSPISMRFPGNEAVDLSGLDGHVEADEGTNWVPKGISVWEMGCNQSPAAKADGDYQKRTDETPEHERIETSFVFVTPRRWNSKDDWLAVRRAEGKWASVCAYDSIDLETWLEEAPVTSRWLGEKLGTSVPGLKTPQEWWQTWATASNPALTTKLVSTRRHNEHEKLLKRLRDGDDTVIVQGDDRGEAVAFVVASLIEAEAHDLLDRTLIATSTDARIPGSSNRLVVIADVAEGSDLDLGDRRNRTIVRAYPKGRMDVKEELLLSHVPSETFRSELEKMGLTRDEAETTALQVGHSVPVLRRRLSNDPDVRRPVWARDRGSVKRLLPFALAGSWVERDDRDDNIVLQLLGELETGEVAAIRDELLTFDDAPIVRYGNVNVVVSQLDALFAVGPNITPEDIERFFQLLPELLGDRDPALDLPEDQRWMADVLGHSRRYSGALLSGLGDALSILSVYGAQICGNRLGIDLPYRAGQVVRSLMENADEDRWLSIRRHLRSLAEASPSVFLDCLDKELRKPEPAIRAIMGSTDGFVSGECLRTHLLWALELLAWQPAHFSRVAEVVFSLRRIEVEDNWTNSPKSTARSLFLPWLPATALGVHDRMAVLRRLSSQHRGPVIDVATSLLPGGRQRFASKNAMPQWRSLEEQVPEPTNDDVRFSAIEASKLLLDLAPFNKAELQQLLETAMRLHPDDLVRLVSEVERWVVDAHDDDKAELRQILRQLEVQRTYQQQEGTEDLISAIQRMEELLEPQAPTARHRWLFQGSHVEWRALIQAEDERNLSWQERNEVVAAHRRAAIDEIDEQQGAATVLSFATSVEHPELVAEVLVALDASPEVAARWAMAALQEVPNSKSNAFLRAVLWRASWNDLESVANLIADSGLLDAADTRNRFAEHLPGRPNGWAVAEALGEDTAASYWSSVSLHLRDETPEEADYAASKLLGAERPRSAFLAAAHSEELLSPDRWVEILQKIARGEEPGGVLPDWYNLTQVFQLLDASEVITEKQIANLELPFVAVISPYGERRQERELALHRDLASDPASFVQFLRWKYLRSDRSVDPEWAELPPERQELLNSLASHVLEGWNVVPGENEAGDVSEEQFRAWADEAMRLATEADRKEVAEVHIGALLARLARRRAWDNWLPTCILDFLDQRENDGLRRHFMIGVANARGVTSRGPYDGGAQERRLAERYRELATSFGNSHPRVSEMLFAIAEGYEEDARRADDQAAVGERWHP